MPLTKQEIFDRGYRGVIEQGCLSMGERSGFQKCCYRHPDDPSIRCALGHCIEDEQYTPGLEGVGAATEEVARLFPGVGRPFLHGFQLAHDNASDIDDFKVRAADFAAQYGLTVPTLELAE